MALTSVCMAMQPYFLRAPRETVVLVRTPCPHPSSVCDHQDCRSHLCIYFPIRDSHRHRHCRPFFVCRCRRNKPVSACPAQGLLPAGLRGQSAIPDLRCVCGDLGRRDSCDKCLRQWSRSDF